MTETTESPYELFYWPTIQGRGEFIRLALEEAGAEYVDVARQPKETGGGVPRLMQLLHDGEGSVLPFAPPLLKSGSLLLSQTCVILAYLGPRHGLCPDSEAGRLATQALQLTISDLVNEVHDTHHPVSTQLYYEDQKPEAARRARALVEHRLPKFLRYFERVLEQGDGAHLVGSATTYADLSLFQVLEGLAYALPNTLSRIEGEVPSVMALRGRVAARPRIGRYLASERRIPFNENGIFRHYPELDLG